jgi:predicted amino acid racemase
MGVQALKTPELEVNLRKIAHNVKLVKNMCDKHGIDLCIVTKGFCAMIPIVESIVSSGIVFLADSRIQNIIKVKNKLPYVKYMMIRIPKISEAKEVIQYTDISLQSQIEVIKAYSDTAESLGKRHDIILMIDVGDLREGIMSDDAISTVEDILSMKGVRLVGIGTNVGCYGGIMPTVENANMLVKIKKEIERYFGINIKYISGGSTCATKLLEEGNLPKDINNLRIGEAVILGEDSTNGRFIDGLYQDAFILKAEVVELKDKPSVPIGEIGYDAFGCKPTFLDKGNRKRAILSVGRQDVRIEALTPVYEGAEILGGSSDHLILDVTDCKEKIKPGDLIPFRCAYSAVLTLTTSPYVYKKYRD